jgi:hypothetical protein
MKRRTADGVTTAAALHSCPLTRRSNACRSGAADARFAPPRRVCGAARRTDYTSLSVAARCLPPTATSDRKSPVNRSPHERVKRRSARVVSVVGFFAPHRPFSQCGHPGATVDIPLDILGERLIFP